MSWTVVLDELPSAILSVSNSRAKLLIASEKFQCLGKIQMD